MRTVALGEVAEVNPRPAAISPADEVSFIGMADLDATRAQTNRGATRRFEEVSKGYTVFQDADILVAKITPCFENNKIGQARLHHKIGVGSTEFHVIRPSELVHDRYLLHFLRQGRIRAQGELRMTGSAGQRRVPAVFYETLALPLPHFDEQRRIAAILDHADALRAKRRQVLDDLDHLAQSIFLDMFGNPDSYVMAGDTIRFGEVADLQGGRNLVAEDEQAVSNFRVLKISAVTSGQFRSDETKPLPVGYTPPVEHVVRSGDLLMSRANTAELVGAVAYVDEAPGNITLPDKIWRFVWKSPKTVPIYFWALFRTLSVRRRVSQLSTGTGGSMKNVSKAKLMQLELPKVSAERQSEYARQLAAIPRPSTHELDELFTSLQSRAFRGEL